MMGDINTTETDEKLVGFLEDRELSNLVHFATCFMSETNPSTIDLIITNKPKSFQDTTGISTGILDSHKILPVLDHVWFLYRPWLVKPVVTSMKKIFSKADLKEIIYRNMKNLDKNAFKCDLKEKLKQTDSTQIMYFFRKYLKML